MTVFYMLSLPSWHPTPLNKLMRMHYMEAHRQNKKNKQYVAAYWLASRHPAATGKRRVAVTLTYAKGKRFHDPDSMQKVLGDALVACGALRNDSPRWVEWLPCVYERSNTESFGTLITLEDI